MRVVVIDHVSLDGVLQGPARPDEDTRDGFTHGGWAADAGSDPAIGAAMGERMGDQFAWLLGRRSYDDMLGHWNEVGGPFKDGLNSVKKYVASSNPNTELHWPNSELLSGDIPAAVGALRNQDRGRLVVLGSGALVRSLLPHDLVDELLLIIHPVVLGSGQRLFGSDTRAHKFELIDCRPSTSGVLLAAYQQRKLNEPAR